MVEIEVRKSEAGTEKASSTNLDVNAIIGKVRDFVGSVRGRLQMVSPWLLVLNALIFRWIRRMVGMIWV